MVVAGWDLIAHQFAATVMDNLAIMLNELKTCQKMKPSLNQKLLKEIISDYLEK